MLNMFLNEKLTSLEVLDCNYTYIKQKGNFFNQALHLIISYII